MVNTVNAFADRILHVFCKERLEPEFAGLVRQVATESHSLVAGEKRRIALRANTQVQVKELDVRHLRFTIGTCTHRL